MSRESRLLKNTAIIGIGVACTKGISFFLLPLYTALLSTKEYGIVDLVTILVTLITYTLTLQFEQGIFRFLIESRNSEEKTKKYISTTLIAVSISLLIGIIILSIVCGIVQYKYIFYLIFNIISCLYCSINSQIARGLGKTVTYTISSFISAVGQIVFNILFIVGLKWHVGGMLTATIIAQFMASFYCIISCKLWNYFSIKSYDKKYLKNLLKFSLPMVPNTLCWWLINLSDRVIINQFLGLGINGIYAVANKFPALYTTLTDIFQRSWAENAAENYEEKDNSIYFSKIMNRSVLLLLSSSLVIILSISLVFKYIVNVNFKASYIHILILIIAAFFHSWGNLYGSLFTAVKSTKNIAKTTVYAAIINVAINLLFINKIGLLAASLSTLISYIIIVIMRHIEINKIVKINYDNKKVLLLIVLLIGVAYIYYINNLIISIIALLLSIVVFCMFNYKIVKFILNKIICRRHKNEKSSS